jgi:hypothetical protein
MKAKISSFVTHCLAWRDDFLERMEQTAKD